MGFLGARESAERMGGNVGGRPGLIPGVFGG